MQVDAEGVRLHVDTTGPEVGEPVVLLHGFPESGWAWRRQIEPLAEAGRRVLAPDQRGYGQSDAPVGIDAYRIERLVGDVLAVADAAAVQRMVLVGHDWGGIVAWAVAAWHPERVARLVILNAPHLDAFRGVILRRPGQVLRSAYVGFFQLPGLSEAALSARDFALLRRAMTATARPGTFEPEDLERYARDWRRPGRLTAMLSYYRALARRPRPRIGQVKVPVTLVWGERDAALSFALAEASLRMCSAGRLVRVPAATHWVQHEEPAVVIEAILRG
jgi:epoxide hydrolase 4